VNCKNCSNKLIVKPRESRLEKVFRVVCSVCWWFYSHHFPNEKSAQKAIDKNEVKSETRVIGEEFKKNWVEVTEYLKPQQQLEVKNG